MARPKKVEAEGGEFVTPADQAAELDKTWPQPATGRYGVKIALLHQSVTIPGGVTTDKTLNAQKFPGIRMEFDGTGLWIHHKGLTGIIPAANVAIAVLE